MLSLAEAIKTGRVADFIAQEEDSGVGPIDRSAFDTLTAAPVKAPQSTDQTSHSASDDGSSERKTRQDNDTNAAG